MRKILSLLCFTALTATSPAFADAGQKTDTVVLVTIDGLRWQEVFRGIDPAYMDGEKYLAHPKHVDSFKKDFDAASKDERRTKLMPFLWSKVAKEGQLYGNRDKGSEAALTNPYHFSYPGYNEILTGIPDPRVDSNDSVPNPNRTVLEWLNGKPENKGKIAAFGSWDAFDAIVNEERAGVPVNSGFDAYAGKSGDKEAVQLNRVQAMTYSPWTEERLDSFTMEFARKALKDDKQRFVYIALGDTDEFAHAGQYDEYVRAAHRADTFLGELWSFLQSDARYKGRTTLIVTVDHGRGSEKLEDFRHHGRFPWTLEDGTEIITDFKGDDQVWMAVIGPDSPVMGEISGGEKVTLSQLAATSARFLGYKDYASDHKELKAGAPIETMLGGK
ncbi:alkaline phosphatase family protein [Pseudokordiimonas caeni]|uniref:alkaline phosphatase family protein n=1 Tax=Pseudokordiimonas caeni TaxID=2997908 RepID=UPI0028113011|nr:alkaline phosphatase family protein [Pseudokordiimonas caeni]